MKALLAVTAILAALSSSCTLLLPTDQLIKPCTSNADCDKGFVCQENACLPADTGEGEGEGGQ
jgi:hypothetical protein